MIRSLSVPRSFLRLTPWLPLAAVLSACASGPTAGTPAPPAILASPIGPSLRRLWDGVGGLGAWQAQGGVRFTYEAELGPGAADLVDSGLDPRTAIAGTKLGPMRIAFRIGDWENLEVEEGGQRRMIRLRTDRSEEGFAGYLPRAARVFALFPLVLAEPGWEFQRVLPMEGSPGTGEILAAPGELPVPHRNYLLVLAPSGGSLEALFYQIVHPGLQGRILKAVPQRFQEFGGIRIATETVHTLCAHPDEPTGRYPWESTKGHPEMALVLRERISAVEFEPRDKGLPQEKGRPAGRPGIDARGLPQPPPPGGGMR